MARSTGKATSALLLRQNRRTWLLLRKLEELTPESFLKQWQLNLRELGLLEANRSWLCDLLRSLSSRDLKFWNSLRQPEEWRQAEKRWPALTAGERENLKGPGLQVLSFLDGYMGENDWEKAILRKICLSLAPTTAETAPAEPIPAPAAAAFIARGLTIGAGYQRQTLSSWLRNFWEQRDPSALVAIVNGDGVREPWVQEAIGELQRLQVEGNSGEQERATEILGDIGKSLSGLGKGRIQAIPEVERPDRKRSSDRVSAQTRRQRAAAEKICEQARCRYEFLLRDRRRIAAEDADRESWQWALTNFLPSKAKDKGKIVQLAERMRGRKA